MESVQHYENLVPSVYILHWNTCVIN